MAWFNSYFPGNSGSASCPLIPKVNDVKFLRLNALPRANHEPAPPVKNRRILLEQSFTAKMPLLSTTTAFGFGRRC